jgi:hypothetical protein
MLAGLNDSRVNIGMLKAWSLRCGTVPDQTNRSGLSA